MIVLGGKAWFRDPHSGNKAVIIKSMGLEKWGFTYVDDGAGVVHYAYKSWFSPYDTSYTSTSKLLLLEQ